MTGEKGITVLSELEQKLHTLGAQIEETWRGL
jgi:hypothetical protein